MRMGSKFNDPIRFFFLFDLFCTFWPFLHPKSAAGPARRLLALFGSEEFIYCFAYNAEEVLSHVQLSQQQRLQRHLRALHQCIRRFY